ncbi:MAG TPA: SpoIIE family protein phosphatase [Bacteroidales bacterium]|nr:SpoIIE family protein phosphatase [Bacteroidales bacterium]
MAANVPERLKISTFKLNALLAITQAINENLPKDDLLKRYEQILKEDLNIGKILIFKHNGVSWECILGSGIKDPKSYNINVDADLLKYSEITFVTSTSITSSSESFDIVIPVYNNSKPLAYVLIGDIEEEGEGVSPTIKHLHFIQTLSSIIIVAIENMRLFQESLRQIAIKKELELASRMQSMLIPKNDELPKNEHIWITSFYHPHLDVGGDYYDFIRLSENEVGFCIADVSGKGISAALLMSNFQANLRALFTSEISLPTLVEKLNERVLKSANGEKFITLFVAKYNYINKELEYINAGHNHPILYETKSKNLVFLKEGCVGMGMLDEIPVIRKGYIKVEQHTKLLCYTDGLVELMDDKEVEFGTTVLEQHISNNSDIKSNIDAIIEDQHILSGNKAIFDDITILGVEFYP